MNDQMHRRFNALSRVFSGQGGFGQVTDEAGRSVDTYRNAQIRDIGVKADQTTRIITSAETAAGVNGASTFTSIYAVNYGMDGVLGWQWGPIKALPVEQENGIIKRTFLEWVGGIMARSTRAIGRLYNVKIS